MKKLLSIMMSVAILSTMLTAFSVSVSAKTITSPSLTGNNNITMKGTKIPTPTYTVTIPTTIAFGECKKAMANDTEANKIKEITVEDIKITHSNLFVNEKQVTVSLSSDFTIKNGNTTLSFELYDGATKLLTGATLITANPTVEDNNVSSSKTLTAKLDKTKIKKAEIYNGVVTFTVALTDIA
ncbi:MAG: hypothetical protein RR263_03745 [Oscillospiraceae bacterium]